MLREVKTGGNTDPALRARGAKRGWEWVLACDGCPAVYRGPAHAGNRADKWVSIVMAIILIVVGVFLASYFSAHDSAALAYACLLGVAFFLFLGVLSVVKLATYGKLTRSWRPYRRP